MSKGKDVVPLMRDGVSFEDWVEEIEFWKIVTSESHKPEQRGSKVFLSLGDDVKAKLRSFKAADLAGSDGLDKLMDKLKRFYGKNPKLQKFQAYEKFDVFKRDSSMGIIDFLNEWTARHEACKALKVELTDDTVLAYLLLKSANLNENQQTLVRSNLKDYSLEEMETKIRALCNEISTSSSDLTATHDNDDVAIKVEPVFHASGYTSGKQNKKFSGSSSSHHGNQRHFEREGGQLNPLDRWGFPKRCYKCGDPYHMASSNLCPARHQNKFGERKITLFANGITNAYLSDFMLETLYCGVLDCGCPDTVCGLSWLNQYLHKLGISVEKLDQCDSDREFRFGNGQTFKSVGLFKLPVNIGKQRVYIETDVINMNIPLLFSNSSRWPKLIRNWILEKVLAVCLVKTSS